MTNLMNIISLSPIWWLLLPLLGLPIWWHRQRRHTQKIKTLATTKFLPSAPPQLLRVWRWRDILLLILRCLMLITLLAILAGLFWSWRGDTVFIAKNLDAKWVQNTLQESSFEHTQQIIYCTENDKDNACEVHTNDLFFWIAQQQAQWQPQARWLVLATADQLPMSGTKPVLQHEVSIRIAPRDINKPTKKTQVFIAIKSARMDEWRRLFSAFEAAGTSNQTFILSEKYEPQAALVIWDQALPLDNKWSAPLIWQTVDKEISLDKNIKTSTNPYLKSLQITEKIQKNLQNIAKNTPQINQQIWTKVWTVNRKTDWPLQRIEDAKKLFEVWQSVNAVGTPIQSQTIKIDKNSRPSVTAIESNLQNYLLILFIILFAIERSLAHVRRS